MGIVSLNIIKSWFKTGLIPTEAQFHDTWDSFHHKEEKIPVQDIQGIDELLDTKADKEVLDDHLVNPDAHKELLDVKLNKVDFDTTAKNLDDRLLAIENPDAVLKYGDLILQGLELKILPGAFEWVLNKEKYVNPDEYTNTISAATTGMYRTDIIVGNLSGGYDIIEGEEASTGAVAAEPSAPDGTIKLGFISVFGNAVVGSGNSEGDLLKGEIHLPAYPNTRNDGQLPTNRVLGTDERGNLRMYTIAMAQAPFLQELIPDSYLPDNTGNFILKGSFFTPTMSVEIQGQIVNYVKFISDNEVHANVTTGSEEGSFSITLNNGLSVTFDNALMISLGIVYTPIYSDWINVVQPIEFAKGCLLVKTLGSTGKAEYEKELNTSKNFRFYITPTISPLDGDPYNKPGTPNTFEIFDINDNSLFWCYNYNNQNLILRTAGNDTLAYFGTNANIFNEIRIDYVDGIWYFYKNGELIYTSTYNNNMTVNAKIVLRVARFDLMNIKYVELI